MKSNFNLSDFPNDSFSIETNVLTGKSIITKNGDLVTQSTEKGRPFLISNHHGDIIKAYPKNTFPDLVPALNINGKKHLMFEKLQWFEYVVGAIPILLLFVGGAIGGAIGGGATIINYSFFRNKENAKAITYIKVLGATVLSYCVFFVISFLLKSVLNKN